MTRYDGPLDEGGGVGVLEGVDVGIGIGGSLVVVIVAEPGGGFGHGGEEHFAPAFGPGVFAGEFGAFFLAGFLLSGEEAGIASFFEGNAAGVEVAAAEGDNVGGEEAEAAEGGVGVGGVSGDEVLGGGSEVEIEPLDEGLGERKESGGGLVGGG